MTEVQQPGTFAAENGTRQNVGVVESIGLAGSHIQHAGSEDAWRILSAHDLMT